MILVKPAGDAQVDKEAVKALLVEIAQLLESDLTEAMNRLEALKQHLGKFTGLGGIQTAGEASRRF